MPCRPDELVSTATCRAGKGTDLRTGELLPASAVSERVGYAIALTKELGTAMLAEHYNPRDLAALGSGVGLDAKPLPAKAYMAGRRLGWACPPLPGVYLSDRARRTIEEQVVRRLRQLAWTDKVITGLVSTWPQGPKKRSAEEWEALWEVLPPGTDKATVRDRTRQVASYRQQHAGLPTGICDLEALVSFGPVLALAAADRQMVELARAGERRAVLKVRLPDVPRPSSMAQWSWVAISIDLPPTVPAPSTLKAPTLRLVGARVRVDLPWAQLVPRLDRALVHRVALGFDWGVNTFLTASLGYFDKGSGDVHTDGRPLVFSAPGVAAKVHRLRQQREVLAAILQQVERLLEGKEDKDLRARAEFLSREIELVSARQGYLNSSLAWAGARWLVDQAIANHATVVYAEDLRTMENRGLGKKTNTRCSNAVRSELLFALRHLANKVGMAVVTVPARGTSAICPRCLHALHHCPSPDQRRQAGHPWAWCRHCGFSADRDHSASERIVSRGLAGQARVRYNKSSGALTCATAVEVKVRRSHRPRPKPQHKFPHRARLMSPAPATPQGTEVHKRPAGTCPTGLEMGCETGAVTVQVALRRRNYRYQRATGRGFHRNVSATLASPRPLWQERETTPRALSGLR
jgi:hypothetical protein